MLPWAGETVTITHKTESFDDDGFTNANPTTTDTTTTAVIRPLTKKDKLFFDVSSVEVGDARGTFLPDVVLAERDLIVLADGTTYKVERIISDNKIANTSMYLSVYLKLSSNLT